MPFKCKVAKAAYERQRMMDPVRWRHKLDRDRQTIKAPHRASKRKAYEANPNGAKRNSYLLRNYGITLDMYNAMLLEQNNKCLFCEEEFGDKPTMRPAVDHCHSTLVVRGLLHSKCNVFCGQEHWRDVRDRLMAKNEQNKK